MKIQADTRPIDPRDWTTWCGYCQVDRPTRCLCPDKHGRTCENPNRRM